MVERFNVVSISLFKCACCHAYVVFCAICVACSDCGLVNYVFSHAFFLERACFLVPASAWVYDLTLWLASSSYACVVLRNYRLDIVHAAITDLDCVSVDCVLDCVSNLAIITKDEISIIKHARKSALFNDGKPWT